MTGGTWDGFNKVRSRRSYYVCGGCTGSWIWADRVSNTRWCCDHCGQQWPHDKVKSRLTNKSSPRPRPRSDRTVLVDKPPGLGGRQPESVAESALRKGWSSLTKEVQEALKGVGIDYTPEPEMQPLEEVLKAHLEALPSEVRSAVEGLLQPAPAAPVDVTGQLKATVGELCQLSQKKQATLPKPWQSAARLVISHRVGNSAVLCDGMGKWDFAATVMGSCWHNTEFKQLTAGGDESNARDCLTVWRHGATSPCARGYAQGSCDCEHFVCERCDQGQVDSSYWLGSLQPYVGCARYYESPFVQDHDLQSYDIDMGVDQDNSFALEPGRVMSAMSGGNGNETVHSTKIEAFTRNETMDAHSLELGDTEFFYVRAVGVPPACCRWDSVACPVHGWTMCPPWRRQAWSCI